MSTNKQPSTSITSNHYRPLDNYLIFISLLLFSALIAYLPFTANNQLVNFVNFDNQLVTEPGDKKTSVAYTLILYPAITITSIAIFTMVILKLKGKLKKIKLKAFDQIMLYLTLLNTSLLMTGQYSKILYLPYAIAVVWIILKKKTSKDPKP